MQDRPRRTAAFATRRARFDEDPPASVVTELGIPTRLEAAAMIAGLEAQLS